jgi:hypothetical protein
MALKRSQDDPGYEDGGGQDSVKKVFSAGILDFSDMRSHTKVPKQFYLDLRRHIQGLAAGSIGEVSGTCGSTLDYCIRQ